MTVLWKKATAAVVKYSVFFFVPWLGTFHLFSDLADDNAITHWERDEELSKKANVGTLLLAVFLLNIAAEILAFRTQGFPVFVLAESVLLLTYCIGFDITEDFPGMITLGVCTLTKICFIIWNFFCANQVCVSQAETNEDVDIKDDILQSVNISLSDMEEIPIETNDNDTVENQ